MQFSEIHSGLECAFHNYIPEQEVNYALLKIIRLFINLEFGIEQHFVGLYVYKLQNGRKVTPKPNIVIADMPCCAKKKIYLFCFYTVKSTYFKVIYRKFCVLLRTLRKIILVIESKGAWIKKSREVKNLSQLEIEFLKICKFRCATKIFLSLMLLLSPD